MKYILDSGYGEQTKADVLNELIYNECAASETDFDDLSIIVIHPIQWENIVKICIENDLTYINNFSFDEEPKFRGIHVYRSYDISENHVYIK